MVVCVCVRVCVMCVCVKRSRGIKNAIQYNCFPNYIFPEAILC